MNDKWEEFFQEEDSADLKKEGPWTTRMLYEILHQMSGGYDFVTTERETEDTKDAIVLMRDYANGSGLNPKKARDRHAVGITMDFWLYQKWS